MYLEMDERGHSSRPSPPGAAMPAQLPGGPGDSVVALVSGGLDSAVLIWWLLQQRRVVVPAFVREGLAWEEAELHHLHRFLAALARPGLADLVVLDLPLADVLGDHWSFGGQRVPDDRSPDAAVYLPGRNLLLIAKAALLAARRDARLVALGLLGGNPFPDATWPFLSTVASACSLALDRPLQVLAPFSGMGKADVLSLGADLPLALTFSCLAPSGLEPCGSCNKCAERRRAFALAGMPDPTTYASRSGEPAAG